MGNIWPPDTEERTMVSTSQGSSISITSAADQVALGPAGAEGFDVLPYGLARLGEDGTILAANLAVGEMLGESALGGATCCQVLGCRTPGTPLEGICLTREALEQGNALPEVRVDIPVDDPQSAVWVTVAPLATDRGVMLHLRPGEVMDRRRRTEPEWLGSGRLHICALGRTSVQRAEVSLDRDWLDQRSGEVFKYLICERNRLVSSDELAEAIWPGSEGRTAPGRVRHYVHAVRSRLEPERAKHEASKYVVARNGGYALARERLTVDVDLFESHASRGMEAYEAGDLTVAQPHLDRANALYRGEFLADEPFADWAFAERERLHEVASEVLRALTDAAVGQDHYARASAHLNRLAALQPFDAEVHREAITMCLRRGRRSEALRRYSILRTRLRRQFDQELDFTVRELQETADTQLKLA